MRCSPPLYLAMLLMGAITASAKNVTQTPDHVIEEGDPLPLQSRAVRVYLWADAYRIGLYFSEQDTIRDLIEHPSEVAVRVEILTDHLPEDPPEAWVEVFREHLSEKLKNRLVRGFAELKPDDVLWFIHDEKGDSRITFNHEPIAVTSGYGMMRSMLLLWVGSDPISWQLREDLIDDYRDD